MCVKIIQTVQEQREDWEYILYACVVFVKECQFRREHLRQPLILNSYLFLEKNIEFFKDIHYNVLFFGSMSFGYYIYAKRCDEIIPKKPQVNRIISFSVQLHNQTDKMLAFSDKCELSIQFCF